jgi:3-methyladenine DNA glycosylase/8-oxoguanine DNA glycosylase
MAVNPVPLIVPCHRCVGGDGSMTGFSTEGGVFLKRQLLFIEGYEPDPEHAAGIRFLQRRDPVMRRLIKSIGPYQAVPDRRGSPFDTLVTAIVHQQLSVKAGRTIAGRVRGLTPGPRYPNPEQMLSLPAAVLRGCGLSRSKTAFVKDLAGRVADGRLKLGRLAKLSDEDVIDELTRVHGIGVWSAQMHLIFHLGRLDVLPTGDLGLRHAAGKAFGLSEHATAAQLTELGTRWQPYRSLASWYLWRSLDAGGV